MIPAAVKPALNGSTVSKAPAAGADAPATPFDAILTLETLAASTVADATATRLTSLEDGCLEGLAEGEFLEGDASDDDVEDGEGVDALAFLADLLNVSAVVRHPINMDTGGGVDADGSGADTSTPDVLSGAGVLGTAGGDAATDKTTGTALLQAVATELRPDTNDKPGQSDDFASVSRALDLTHTARHSSNGPERSGIATHVRDPRWADDFSARIAMMVRANESSASLQLSPVDLGPMDVNVTVKDNQASIHFGAAQAETRALIEASIPRLREMLAAQGFNLMDASVSQGFARQARGNIPSAPRADSDRATEAVTTTRVSASGLLDLYA